MGGPIPNPFQSKPSAPAPTPPAPVAVAPTAAEVSQASATDMDAKGIKRRRRGRSPTILTSPLVDEATTEKKSLLGM